MKLIGRPPTLKSATRRNIYIPNELWEVARAIGDGSACAGIRIAIEQHHKPRLATSDKQKPK